MFVYVVSYVPCVAWFLNEPMTKTMGFHISTNFNSGKLFSFTFIFTYRVCLKNSLWDEKEVATEVKPVPGLLC